MTLGAMHGDEVILAARRRCRGLPATVADLIATDMDSE